ncbi:MAG: class I SAM-dependent methyltransferase [Rhizobiales bacterium]|nr:class I SAM-dependent methyltransferase [Hyphomicrobiales bacterium]OJU30185.1 MAG: hypothetical protein BGN94_14560 [Rhizobiales bacterium 68-8]
MPTIDDVRNFWNANPLWTGEAKFAPGTREFYDEHTRLCIEEGWGGEIDPLVFPEKRGKLLDLGCGIGFWPPQFWARGWRDITAADLSPQSLNLARSRAEIYGVQADFREENAENLSFPDETFDHVHCHGVVHHTTDPSKAVREIHRVLKVGGTAMISVYYKNLVLRNFGLFRPLALALGRTGARLRGRGRESIYSVPDVSEIVRLYDGAANPIGYAYDRREFFELLGPGFRVDHVFFHFFPARSLPVRLPRFALKWLDRSLPFLIHARVTKL